jgi:uracil-DNA glycosylase family 4
MTTLIPLSLVRARIICCGRCRRLRAYCRAIARQRRRAYREEIYWARPVPGFGDPRARLLIVGLAPAAHGANRTGRMFTGDGEGGSGAFLMAALHRNGFANMATSDRADDGLKLRDAFLTAAVRCAPPGNKPTPIEIASCAGHLRAEFDALPSVRVVVALGRIAFDASVRLLAVRTPGPRPAFGHGREHAMADGRSLIACYHPSRQNTQTGRLTPAMIDRVFRRARRLLDGRRNAPEGSRRPTGSRGRP